VFRQAQLGGLEGLSSGLMESLPASVKRRVKALKKMQVRGPCAVGPPLRAARNAAMAPPIRLGIAS